MKLPIAVNSMCCPCVRLACITVRGPIKAIGFVSQAADALRSPAASAPQ